MLNAINVTKKFGGLLAVNNVSLSIEKGEILGLIGPNGSGKTTMFNLITGFLKVSDGEVSYKNKNITDFSPENIVKLGISRTFQITSILSDLTVNDNILAGLFGVNQSNLLDILLRNKKYKKETSAAEGKCTSVLKLVNLENKKDFIAGKLTPAEQRKLMIGIAIAKKPELLMLDEPAAGTTKEEQDELIEIVRTINKQGTTVLIIEHHMHVIMNVCKRIIAFNFGEKIAEGTPEEIQNNEAVVEAYLGSDDIES